MTKKNKSGQMNMEFHSVSNTYIKKLCIPYAYLKKQSSAKTKAMTQLTLFTFLLVIIKITITTNQLPVAI